MTLLSGIMLFAGFPLIGWGMAHWDTYFENPARMAYIVIMIVLSAVVMVWVPENSSEKREGIKLQQKHKISLFVLQIVPVLIVFSSPWFDRHQIAVFSENLSLRYFGVSLASGGFLFMNWSAKVLDKQFSINVTVQKNHKLITSGPYKKIRHPRYLGILVFFSGISLTFLSWADLLLVLATLAVLIWRVIDEEKLMHEEFGKEWEVYKKNSSALIPHLF